MTAIIIIIVAIIVPLAAIAFLYNSMIRGRNMVNEAWSGVDVQLKRRHDLIPNLVSVIKQYASHERSLFEEIAAVRARSMSITGDVAAQAKSENMLSGALRSLLAVAEAYPELKASENFLQLQGNLDKLEDEIQMARRFYNGAARDQNNRTMQFPGNIIAKMFSFKAIDYFELENTQERQTPNLEALMN